MSSSIPSLPQKVMLCFVTQQAITNTVPALMLDVDMIIPIYTHTAYMRKWNEGFLEVMHSKRPNLEIHPVFLSNSSTKEQWSLDPNVCTCSTPTCTLQCSRGWLGPEILENDLMAVLKLLGNTLEKFEGDTEFYLNVGGGLKLHTMALQQLHTQYATNPQYTISIAYLNSQASPVTLNIYNNSFDLEAHVLNETWDSSFLSIKEYTRLFFLNYIGNHENENRQNYNYHFLAEPDSRAFLAYMSNIGNEKEIVEVKTFRELLTKFKGSIKKNIEKLVSSDPQFQNLGDVSQIPEKVIKSITKTEVQRNPPVVKLNSNSMLHGVLGSMGSSIHVTAQNYEKWAYKVQPIARNDKRNPGRLMEYYVAEKLEKTLLDGGKVADIAKSFILKKGNSQYAEIDLLALTKEGRLAGIEIKTTSYSTKDIQSAQHKLRNISGVLNIPCIVIPLFVADKDLQYLKDVKEVFKAISNLHKTGNMFCIFTNRTKKQDADVYLIQTGRNDFDLTIVDQLAFQQSTSKTKIICTTTTNFFKSRGLI